jgi:hexosaminidase
MLALSEALWTKERNKDFDDFNVRLQSHKKLLTSLGYHFSNGSYRLGVKSEFDSLNNCNTIALTSDQYQPEIRYITNDTVDLKDGTVYDGPFTPQESCTITSGIFVEGELQRKPTQFEYVKHLGLGKGLYLKEKPHRKYGAKIKNGLIDGILGSDNFRDGKWSGFKAKDLIAEIDMYGKTDIQSVSFSYIYDNNAWVLPPKAVSVFVKYEGGDYHLISEKDLQSLLDKSAKDHGHIEIPVNTNDVVALKIKIESYQLLPDDHAYAGNECWMFVDEIIIK